MENASKALLIAGSVLIVILLISVGMIIFNSSKGLISSGGSTMTKGQKDAINSRFTKYEGNNISGDQVIALIRDVVTNNIDEDNNEITINGTKITKNTDPTMKPWTNNKNSQIKPTDRFKVQCIYNEGTGLIDNIEVDQR